MRDNADLIEDIIDRNAVNDLKEQALDDTVDEMMIETVMVIDQWIDGRVLFYGVDIRHKYRALDERCIGSSSSDDRDEAIMMAEIQAKKYLRERISAK
jgi:hypothetical protein